MKTKYGKKIVFVVALTFEDFKNFVATLKNTIPSPAGSHGVVYTQTHNYRFVEDFRSLVGHKKGAVEFLKGAEKRSDYNQLIVLAKGLEKE